jgi:hypothetical protein
MNLKSVTQALLGSLFFFSNVIAVYSAESNFWAERHAQTKRQFNPNAGGPAVPASGEAVPAGPSPLLLAQLPGIHAVGLNGSVSSDSLAIGVPLQPVDGIHRQDLNVARLALTRDGSADWLDPIVNPYGAVREIHLSEKADSPLIIHIQDVHGYADAQKNIAGLISGFSKYRGVTLIGMEGAEGAFALEDLRRFPDRDIKERVTDWAIKKELIGGAEKCGITSEKPLKLWGVEKTALYQSNVQAVKESIARRSEALAFHRDLMKNVAGLKAAVYSEELKNYDENLLAYQDKRRGLGEYLKHLVGQFPGGERAVSQKFPNTADLLNALGQESKLDFKQVERERVSLVELLAARLNENTLNGLVKESMAYREGRVTYSRYYAFVKTLCRQGKIDVEKYSALTAYIAYVGMSEKINRTQLLSELERLEDSVAGELARTELERGVLDLSRDTILLGKLMNNAMTPADWARYLTRRAEMLKLETRGKSLARQVGVEFESGVPSDFAGFVKPFEDFCRLALARNEAFADGLFAKMGEDRVKTAVLVTGGFHSEGLMAEIDRRGGSYVVLTPRVEIVQSDKNYLDAFAHDPVPLEKLFNGEKISILTARTTTVGAEQPGEVSGSQKIGLAMVAEIVRAWVFELKDQRSFRDIRETISKRLADLLSGLGGVFRKMAVRIGSVSPKGFVLNAKVAGTNYRVGSSSGEGISVALPPVSSWDGFENAYTQFARTRFGAWMKGMSVSLFQSMAEIFFAPAAEKQLTNNLFQFGKRHGFLILPLSPLDWVAMLVNKSTDWNSVFRSVGGWTAIASMGMAGFSPTIAAFYFTFVDPVGIFSSALGLMLFAVTAVINYTFRTNFYLAPHGFINAVLIGLNLVLAGFNRFIPPLTFRFARMTLGDYSFNSAARRITQADKDRFLEFLQKFKNDPNMEFPSFNNKSYPVGYQQLLYNLAWEANIHGVDPFAINDDEIVRGVRRAGVVYIGGEIIEKLNREEVTFFTNPSDSFFDNLAQNRLYTEVPPFLSTQPGLTVFKSLENVEDNSGEVFAQIYDEWIRRCFWAATQAGDSLADVISNLADVIRNMDLWFELIDEIQNGRDPSSGEEWDPHEINDSASFPYNGPSQLVLSPGNFEVVLDVYSATDLPENLKRQVKEEGLEGSAFFIVRKTKYGAFIMGLNEGDTAKNIGLNDGGFSTVVEIGHIPDLFFSISVKNGINLFKQSPNSVLVVRTPKPINRAIPDGGAKRTYELRASEAGSNVFSYAAPFQIVLSTPKKETVVWVYKRKDLPQKYNNLAGSGDPEDVILATSFEGRDQVVQMTQAGVTLSYPSTFSLDWKVMNASGYPAATVYFDHGKINIAVFQKASILFGFPQEVSSDEKQPKRREKTPAGKALSEMQKGLMSRDPEKNLVSYLILRAARNRGLVNAAQGLTEEEVAAIGYSIELLPKNEEFREILEHAMEITGASGVLATIAEEKSPFFEMSFENVADAIMALKLLRAVQQKLTPFDPQVLSIKDIFTRKPKEAEFRIFPAYFNNEQIMQIVKSADESPVDAFSTYLHSLRVLQIAGRLISGREKSFPGRLREGAAAYRRLWVRVRSLDSFPHNGSADKQSAFIERWLATLGFKGQQLGWAKDIFISDDMKSAIAQVEGFREDEYDFVEQRKGEIGYFEYEGPFPLILEDTDSFRDIYFVYEFNDLPSGLKEKIRKQEGSEGLYLIAGNGDTYKLSPDSVVELTFPASGMSGKPHAEVALHDSGKIKIQRLSYVRVIVGRNKQQPVAVDIAVIQNGGKMVHPDDRITLSNESRRAVIEFLQGYFGRLRKNDDWNGQFIHQLLTMKGNRITVSVSLGDGLGENRIAPTLDNGVSIQLTEREFNELPTEGKIPGIENLFQRARQQWDAIREAREPNELNSSQIRQIKGVLHPDRALWREAEEALKSVTSEQATRSSTWGFWGLWKPFGLNSVAGAILEAVFYLVGTTLFANLLIPSGALSHGILTSLFLDVTGTTFLVMFVVDFLIHFFGGVGRSSGQPSVTIWHDGLVTTTKAAFRATLTATNNAYMLPFVVAALLAMPVASWAAWPLLVFGYGLGAYKHAMANYRIELSTLSSHPAEGVTVLSTPLTADGIRAPAPRASLIGMLKFAFAGGEARTQYDGVSRAIHQVLVTQQGLNAGSESVTSVRLASQPGTWVAQQALANWNNREAKAMEPLLAFLNTVAFLASHIAEMAMGHAADDPVLIEVPSEQMRKDNPKAMEALAAVVMAGMETSARPMALVSRSEPGRAAPVDVILEVRSLLESNSSVAAAQFSSGVASGQIQLIVADDKMLKDGKFHLKEILTSTYAGQSINSPLVFGDEAHFEAEGTEAVFKNYLTLAASLTKLLRERILFAIQA